MTNPHLSTLDSTNKELRVWLIRWSLSVAKLFCGAAKHLQDTYLLQDVSNR